MSKEVARNIGMRYFLPSVKKGRCCRGSAPPRCVMAAGGNFWSFSLRRTTQSCKRGASDATMLRSGACTCLVDAANDAACVLQQRLQHQTNEHSSASSTSTKTRAHTHRVIQPQHLVQQRAKLNAAPARNAIQRLCRRPDAGGCHLYLVLLQQLVRVLERLTLQLLEVRQGACFRRAPRCAVGDQQQPEWEEQLMGFVRDAA
jgi:hypothetical protein